MDGGFCPAMVASGSLVPEKKHECRAEYDAVTASGGRETRDLKKKLITCGRMLPFEKI